MTSSTSVLLHYDVLYCVLVLLQPGWTNHRSEVVSVLLSVDINWTLEMFSHPKYTKK